MNQRAIFLDRDGTIINDFGYVFEKEKLEFLDSVIPGLKALQDFGYKLIIISNQSGVGRGYFSLEEMNAFNDYLLEKLKEQDITISGIYICPHHPEEDCSCRKPKAFLVEKAAKDLKINLKESFFVGDEEKDILCGKNSGCRTVWLKNKKALNETKPDFTVNDFLDFVRLISELAN